MKIIDIITFKNYYEEIVDEKIPFNTAYKLNKIYKSVLNDITWYQGEFNKLIEKYAKIDENGDYVYSADGDTIAIKEEDIEECNLAVIELNNVEFNYDREFTIEEVEKLPNIKLAYFEMLMNFIN